MSNNKEAIEKLLKSLIKNDNCSVCLKALPHRSGCPLGQALALLSAEQEKEKCSTCNQSPCICYVGFVMPAEQGKCKTCGGSEKIPKRFQSCGCIICVCEDEEKCRGCGAVKCEKHKNAGIFIPETQTCPDCKGTGLQQPAERKDSSLTPILTADKVRQEAFNKLEKAIKQQPAEQESDGESKFIIKIFEFHKICERLYKSYTPQVDKDEARTGVLGHHPLAMLVITNDIIEQLQSQLKARDEQVYSKSLIRRLQKQNPEQIQAVINALKAENKELREKLTIRLANFDYIEKPAEREEIKNRLQILADRCENNSEAYVYTATIKEFIRLEAQLKARDEEIERLKELLRYPFSLPHNTAGIYEENTKWEKEAEQALKE